MAKLEKIKLKRKNYLGEGFVLQFQNIETGEIVNQDCTKRKFEQLSEGILHKKKGFILIGGFGGFDKVDNVEGEDSENQVYVKNNKFYVNRKDEKGFNRNLEISETELNDKFLWQ